jgi:cation diffusion facilitator CzcD-associated flavoprotein CzcO
VIGAGPHGLSTTAHLRAAGVETVCFGEPAEFWRAHMPAGMVLRSRWRSTHISDPKRALTIDHFAQSQARSLHEPWLLLEEFVEYALWFQRQAVPDLDRRRVASLSRHDGAFRVVLEDGTELTAARVVVAAGLAQFARWPEPFSALPRTLVSHSFDHTDLASFAGQRLLVVGAGQSALESAALLSEAGAGVELLIRGDSIRWLWSRDSDEPSPAPDPGWASPPTDIGDPLNGWVAAIPDLFRRLPAALRERIAYRCIRPAGSGWLRPRLRTVKLSFGRRALSAEPSGSQVRVVLDDSSERVVDHVLLGTGYALDVAAYPFLAPELAREIAVAGGYPLLGPGLESSVAGLHFVGAAAAISFGPVMRFVVGTHYGAPAVARRALGRPQPAIRFSF